MKIKIWKQIVDCGDGSTTTNIFPTKEEAFEGYDEEGFDLEYPDIPIEVEEGVLDITRFEVVG